MGWCGVVWCRCCKILRYSLVHSLSAHVHVCSCRCVVAGVHLDACARVLWQERMTAHRFTFKELEKVVMPAHLKLLLCLASQSTGSAPQASPLSPGSAGGGLGGGIVSAGGGSGSAGGGSGSAGGGSGSAGGGSGSAGGGSGGGSGAAARLAAPGYGRGGVRSLLLGPSGLDAEGDVLGEITRELTLSIDQGKRLRKELGCVVLAVRARSPLRASAPTHAFAPYAFCSRTYASTR
jgi:hypothetical protein